MQFICVQSLYGLVNIFSIGINCRNNGIEGIIKSKIIFDQSILFHTFGTHPFYNYCTVLCVFVLVVNFSVQNIICEEDRYKFVNDPCDMFFSKCSQNNCTKIDPINNICSVIQKFLITYQIIPNQMK